jgi:prophage tail gpP-like protein
MFRDVQYVLDGGALLQRIPWMKGATFNEMLTVYTDYVLRKYRSAIVVFDGYLSKDMTHQRQMKGLASTTVTFTETMQLTMRKAQFLSNTENKQCFINMLSAKAQCKACGVELQDI